MIRTVLRLLTAGVLLALPVTQSHAQNGVSASIGGFPSRAAAQAALDRRPAIPGQRIDEIPTESGGTLYRAIVGVFPNRKTLTEYCTAQSLSCRALNVAIAQAPARGTAPHPAQNAGRVSTLPENSDIQEAIRENDERIRQLDSEIANYDRLIAEGDERRRQIESQIAALEADIKQNNAPAPRAAQAAGRIYKLKSYNAAEVLSLVEKGLEASHRGGLRSDERSLCAMRLAVMREHNNPKQADAANPQYCTNGLMGWEYSVALFGTLLDYIPDSYRMGASDVCVISGMADKVVGIQIRTTSDLDFLLTDHLGELRQHLATLLVQCRQSGPLSDAFDDATLNNYLTELASYASRR